jgi:hypothetical protein
MFRWDSCISGQSLWLFSGQTSFLSVFNVQCPLDASSLRPRDYFGSRGKSKSSLYVDFLMLFIAGVSNMDVSMSFTAPRKYLVAWA